MAKKKKNKLLSGYYDASASKNVTDANIEENENGWKIVKNKSTVSRLPNKVSSNTESQNNNVQKLKNKREELSNNPFKQTTINLPQIAPVNKQNSTNNIKESLNAAVKSKLTKDAFQENLNNEIRKNAITSKKEKKETQTKVDLEKINRPLYTEPKKETGLLENATKSSSNFLTRLGKGIALDFPEQILDSGLQIGSSKRNPIMHLTNKEKDFGERLKDAGKSMLANVVDISPVGWIDKLVQKVNPSIDDDTISEKLLNSIDDKGIKNRQKIAEEIIKKDASQSFMDNQLGYSKKLSNGKTIQETLDEGALIKSDNTGGKIAENIGQMLPSLMTGGQAQSLTTMGISSFGSGMEEAYNSGATREEATKYGLLNSAIEIGTEKMFAGVGGVFGKGAFDDVVKEGIQNRIKSEVGKQLVGLGIDSLGEGTEELISSALQPLAQKLTYASEEDLMKLYENQDFAESFVTGALSSLLLQGANITTQQSINNSVKNEIKKTINEDNSYEIMKKLQEQGYTQEQSIQLVNKALKEIGQPQISIENIVQNETTQQTNTNTPQISQEIGQNQELSNKITNNLQTQKVSEIEQYKSKTFDRDYKKFESGKYTDNDNLILLDSTPEYFYNLGYDTNKPIVVSMDKLNTIMKEEKLTTEDGKHQHGITKEIIEQLPYAISNPLNVIKNPKFDNRFVIVTELSDKYGDIIIVPIEMNTKGHIENVLQDVNRVVSTYGKEQYDGNDDLTFFRFYGIIIIS